MMLCYCKLASRSSQMVRTVSKSVPIEFALVTQKRETIVFRYGFPIRISPPRHIDSFFSAILGAQGAVGGDDNIVLLKLCPSDVLV